MKKAPGWALGAFKHEESETGFLPPFLPQEAGDGEEGWAGKMGKASPDMTTAGEGRVRASEKIHTEGLSCRGQRSHIRFGRLRKSGRIAGRRLGGGQFGRTHRVCGRVLGVKTRLEQRGWA